MFTALILWTFGHLLDPESVHDTHQPLSFHDAFESYEDVVFSCSYWWWRGFWGQIRYCVGIYWLFWWPWSFIIYTINYNYLFMNHMYNIIFVFSCCPKIVNLVPTLPELQILSTKTQQIRNPYSTLPYTLPFPLSYLSLNSGMQYSHTSQNYSSMCVPLSIMINSQCIAFCFQDSYYPEELPFLFLLLYPILCDPLISLKSRKRKQVRMEVLPFFSLFPF